MIENQTFVRQKQIQRSPISIDVGELYKKNQKYNINNLLELKGSSSTKLTILQRFCPFNVKFGTKPVKTRRISCSNVSFCE